MRARLLPSARRGAARVSLIPYMGVRIVLGVDGGWGKGAAACMPNAHTPCLLPWRLGATIPSPQPRASLPSLFLRLLPPRSHFSPNSLAPLHPVHPLQL